jgi:hypothetical protein
VQNTRELDPGITLASDFWLERAACIEIPQLHTYWWLNNETYAQHKVGKLVKRDIWIEIYLKINRKRNTNKKKKA